MKRNFFVLGTSVFVASFLACKPQSETKLEAISGTDSDGKRKAFSLIPIKPEGFTSPISVASLGLIECQQMGDVAPEVVIRTIEIIGAAGQLFFNGKDVVIPKALSMRLTTNDGKEVNQDPRDNMPVRACSLVKGTIPFNYEEVSAAANRLASVVGGAKSFDAVKSEYVAAQSIFLAMRGATELDSNGRPLSLDGAPLLAQLEVMSGASAIDIAQHMSKQDNIYNPCLTNVGVSGLPQAISDPNLRKRYFSCGRAYTANGKTFHHYEVGGSEKSMSYAAIRDEVLKQLTRARQNRSASLSLTDGAAAGAAAGASTGSSTSAAAGSGATASTASESRPAGSAATSSVAGGGSATSTAQSRSIAAVELLPVKAPGLETAGYSQEVVKDNVTGAGFVHAPDWSSITELKFGGESPLGTTYGNRAATSDGNNWTAQDGSRVSINANKDRLQRWDANGNLQNGALADGSAPSPYRFNYKPGANNGAGTFQLMRGETPVGPAMPAIMSEDKKYVGISAEDQVKLVDTMMGQATVNGQLDQSIVRQMAVPLATARQVSFYRNADGNVNEQSFGHVYDVFSQRVASFNQQASGSETVAGAATGSAGAAAATGAPAGTGARTEGAAPTQARVQTDSATTQPPRSAREQGLGDLLALNNQMRSTVNPILPQSNPGAATVDPRSLSQSMTALGPQIEAMQAKIDALYQQENQAGVQPDLQVRDRARSDLVMLRTRELKAAIEELKAKQQEGLQMSQALAGGSQHGPGGSSYGMAYTRARAIPGEIEALQAKVNGLMTKLNDAGNPYMPVDSQDAGREGSGALANHQGMIQSQIDGLNSRMERIQQQIRGLRSDPANFSQVQGLEQRIIRIQQEIDDRRKVLGNPYYVPRKI